ncbi:hypothetical protein [Ignatzschineria indica]
MRDPTISLFLPVHARRTASLVPENHHTILDVIAGDLMTTN